MNTETESRGGTHLRTRIRFTALLASFAVAMTFAGIAWAIDAATPGNDNLRGDDSANVIDGLAGNDRIWGLDANDDLKGSEGNDTLKGGDGDDTLDGGAGKDRLDGAKGKDELTGGEGDDRLRGSSGNDSLDGGAGNDKLRGDKGDDSLTGGEGDDDIRGGKGKDEIGGGGGADRLSGRGDGNVSDTIDCGAGDGSVDRVRADRNDKVVNCGPEDRVHQSKPKKGKGEGKDHAKVGKPPKA